MKTLSWLGIAAVAVLATSCSSSSRTVVQSNARSYNGASFSGEWRLVRGLEGTSESLADPSHVEDWSSPAAQADRSRYSEWFLPDAVRIGSDSQTLRVQDDTGTLLAEYALDSDFPKSATDDRDSQGRARAHWATPQQIAVERIGEGGRRMTQTFTLEQGDKRLVVAMQIEGDGAPRTYTRVYEKI